MYEYWLLKSVVTVVRISQVIPPKSLCQIVIVASIRIGVMDPLMVVLSPIVIVVGDTEIKNA